MNIVDVSLENIDQTGFFCFMSKRKSIGYKRKHDWLTKRFDEGMRIKMLDLKEGGRGFIEYIPGRYAWRSVNADDYMFIHCLWVVGKSKGNGYGTLLLNECIEDAKRSGLKGVAMLTSEKVWLAKRGFFEASGFECVAEAAPSFCLMLKHFGDNPAPTFSGDWEKKASRCGEGITLFQSAQCPYIDDAAQIIEQAAGKQGLPFQSVEFESAEEIRERSPSPYGVFSIVHNGRFLSYHYLTEKDFIKALDS